LNPAPEVGEIHILLVFMVYDLLTLQGTSQINVERQRLLVAELGNDTIGVVDLKERKTVDTVDGLAELPSPSCRRWCRRKMV